MGRADGRPEDPEKQERPTRSSARVWGRRDGRTLRWTVKLKSRAGQEVRLNNGDTVVATIGAIAAFGPWHAARERILEGVTSGAWLGGKLGVGVVVIMFGWFRYQGHRLKQKKRLRGAELVSAQELSRRVCPLLARALEVISGAPAPYRIAGVPYNERTETQHTIISGVAAEVVLTISAEVTPPSY